MTTCIETPDRGSNKETALNAPVFDDPVAFFGAFGLDVEIVTAKDTLARAA